MARLGKREFAGPKVYAEGIFIMFRDMIRASSYVAIHSSNI